MNNEVAIFTFINANNYGAMLQAYALGKFLEENDFKPFYVDINMNKKIYSIKSLLRGYIVKKHFNPFRNKYFSLIPISKIHNFNTLIYGSDQIWNIEIVKDNLSLFSGYGASSSAKKIAYAASFGVDSIDKNLYKGFEEKLNKFSQIMVRESSAMDLLKDNFNIESKQVLDPTFLINNYNEITESKINKKGICCYLFSDFNRDYESLDQFSKNINEKIYFLNQTRTPVGDAVAFPKVNDWLSYVINSQYVITDSFHCMVMALLHNINFYVVSARVDRFVRISSLLKSLNLETRILESVSVLANSSFKYENIDYITVNKRLEVLKKDSKKLLLDSLKNEKMDSL